MLYEVITNLTHPAGDGENLLALLEDGFTISAVDGDGDRVDGGIKLYVDVKDDIPVLLAEGGRRSAPAGTNQPAIQPMVIQPAMLKNPMVGPY